MQNLDVPSAKLALRTRDSDSRSRSVPRSTGTSLVSKISSGSEEELDSLKYADLSSTPHSSFYRFNDDALEADFNFEFFVRNVPIFIIF